MSSKVKTIVVSCTAYFYVQIYNSKEDYNIKKKKKWYIATLQANIKAWKSNI